jgi:hypothetical protein
VIYFSKMRLVPFAIGMGMVAYAIAVAFYTLLAIWRILRRLRLKTQPPAANAGRWWSKLTRVRPTGSFKLLAACIRRR